MQGFVLLILNLLLFSVVIGIPVTKLKPKHKTTKGVASINKNIQSKVISIKSKHSAFKWLTKYGYNSCENPADSELEKYNRPSCQMTFESILKNFQTAHHLPVTKELDADTLKLMNTPRCNLSDFPTPLVDRSKRW